MRFLVDMDLGTPIVNALRRAGHDAVHLREEGLQNLRDDHIVLKARSENRIILTHDLDFPRLLAVSDATEPSVIVFRLSDMRSQSVMTHLLAALDHFEAELGQGAVVSVADKTMRCHLLPILRRH